MWFIPYGKCYFNKNSYKLDKNKAIILAFSISNKAHKKMVNINLKISNYAKFFCTINLIIINKFQPGIKKFGT